MAKKKTEVSATNGKALATKAAAPLAKSHGTKIAARGFENLEREDSCHGYHSCNHSHRRWLIEERKQGRCISTCPVRT